MDWKRCGGVVDFTCTAGDATGKSRTGRDRLFWHSALGAVCSRGSLQAEPGVRGALPQSGRGMQSTGRTKNQVEPELAATDQALAWGERRLTEVPRRGTSPGLRNRCRGTGPLSDSDSGGASRKGSLLPSNSTRRGARATEDRRPGESELEQHHTSSRPWFLPGRSASGSGWTFPAVDEGRLQALWGRARITSRRPGRRDPHSARGQGVYPGTRWRDSQRRHSGTPLFPLAVRTIARGRGGGQ